MISYLKKGIESLPQTLSNHFIFAICPCQDQWKVSKHHQPSILQTYFCTHSALCKYPIMQSSGEFRFADL